MQEIKFRPSNATHGDSFMAGYCLNCRKYEPQPDKYCNIIALTMAYDIDDEKHPSDYVYRDGQPTCTAFERKENMVSENPVFVLFAFVLLFMLFYGYLMDSRVAKLETQVQQIERVQRGD